MKETWWCAEQDSRRCDDENVERDVYVDAIMLRRVIHVRMLSIIIFHHQYSPPTQNFPNTWQLRNCFKRRAYSSETQHSVHLSHWNSHRDLSPKGILLENTAVPHNFAICAVTEVKFGSLPHSVCLVKIVRDFSGAVRLRHGKIHVNYWLWRNLTVT